jgi:C-terminal processing protease CtpA/Prc
MNEIGGVIAKVYPDTIAWETGLEEGDIITKINNQVVRDLIDFEYLWAEENVELSV